MDRFDINDKYERIKDLGEAEELWNESYHSKEKHGVLIIIIIIIIVVVVIIIIIIIIRGKE